MQFDLTNFTADKKIVKITKKLIKNLKKTSRKKILLIAHKNYKRKNYMYIVSLIIATHPKFVPIFEYENGELKVKQDRFIKKRYSLYMLLIKSVFHIAIKARDSDNRTTCRMVRSIIKKNQSKSPIILLQSFFRLLKIFINDIYWHFAFTGKAYFARLQKTLLWIGLKFSLELGQPDTGYLFLEVIWNLCENKKAIDFTLKKRSFEHFAKYVYQNKIFGYRPALKEMANEIGMKHRGNYLRKLLRENTGLMLVGEMIQKNNPVNEKPFRRLDWRFYALRYCIGKKSKTVHFTWNSVRRTGKNRKQRNKNKQLVFEALSLASIRENIAFKMDFVYHEKNDLVIDLHSTPTRHNKISFEEHSAPALLYSLSIKKKIKKTRKHAYKIKLLATPPDKIKNSAELPIEKIKNAEEVLIAVTDIFYSLVKLKWYVKHRLNEFQVFYNTFSTKFVKRHCLVFSEKKHEFGLRLVDMHNFSVWVTTREHIFEQNVLVFNDSPAYVIQQLYSTRKFPCIISYFLSYKNQNTAIEEYIENNGVIPTINILLKKIFTNQFELIT